MGTFTVFILMLMLAMSFSISETSYHRLVERKHKFRSSESYNNGEMKLLAHPKLKSGLKDVKRRTISPPPSPTSNQPSYYRCSKSEKSPPSL
ncbi:hypothetical protein SUGI_0325970 [Cryptomeria japonica]|nr:hypothetical protein SUGI_0325970 [Cryptomeria japonica]